MNEIAAGAVKDGDARVKHGPDGEVGDRSADRQEDRRLNCVTSSRP